MKSSATADYLALYAEARAREALPDCGPYAAALIVPALGEARSSLDGYRVAAGSLVGRLLVVLVVNATAAADPTLRAANQRLLCELGRPASGDVDAWLVAEPEFDVLVVDRSSGERCLPNKQGVGLARKLGADLALALHQRGALASPWLYFTDADVELPVDYFLRGEARGTQAASALLYPFSHRAGGDDVVDQATFRYEASLRYHTLGLAWAGSPYAFHSLGSTLAVHTHAYALVRGVPKRQAGEDFYLLDKLVKVAPLRRLEGAPLRIRARRSLRVPFGTGPRVETLLTGESPLVASVAAFGCLRATLSGLRAFAGSPSAAAFDAEFALLDSSQRAAAERSLAQSGLLPAAFAAARAVGLAGLSRRLFSWFDALRTLQFLHALRANGLAEVPLAQGLAEAPFASIAAGPAAAQAQALAALEQALPAAIGPSLLAAGR